MKLLVTVIQARDLENLTLALHERGYAATQVHSAGGFLREQNVTLLIGVDDEAVAEVIRIIKANCYSRVQYVNPLLPIVDAGEVFLPNPVEVQVGGAHVFVLPVERLVRLP
ncbi:cyclic-di-AMP receptor [Thermorudis peleae]|jgi:uncharacterized protein YaaQ|uniref:cyclic-di-AMP receptor n=1 Tax=Thermorudis peleae TaxID=1382356 RepID=UPI00056F7AA1|nr:cyclic-di-AMP receptor [Thermorudis peleae]MBX6755386.1 cyclic-di-AMP receptor [Thermorudis peleae]